MRLSFGEELRRAQERGRQRQLARNQGRASHARKFQKKPKSATFACGHDRIAENTYWLGQFQRCLTCKRAAAAQWAREHREPKGTRRVPLYKDTRDGKLLLEQCWRPQPVRPSA